MVRSVAVFALVLAAATPAHANWLWFPFDHDVGRSRGFSAGHTAIDFVAPCGTRLYAAAEGVVSEVVQNNGCRECYDCGQGCANAYVGGRCQNNQIYIDHPDGHQTRYLHIEQGSARVARGDPVRAGQLIARTGNVGWTCGATGCHLHFELRAPGGRAIDPDGEWTRPRRFGGEDPGPPPDEEAPQCSFPSHPALDTVLRDGEARVEWRVTDAGGSALLGASQSWDAPIPRDSEPQFDFAGEARHDGHLVLDWAGVGRHRAYVRAWDRAGNTCKADLGELWYFPVPFVRSWLLSDPLLTGGGAQDRLGASPLGDEAALLPGRDDAGWRVHASPDDLVDLDAALGGDERVAYAMTYCYHPEEAREVDLRVGSDDGFRVYVNGERRGADVEPRGAAPDQDVIRVRLEPGYNAVLLEVEEKAGAWGFYARFSEVDPPEAGLALDCRPDFRGAPCAADADCLGDTACLEGACRRPPEPEPDRDAALDDPSPDRDAGLDDPSPDRDAGGDDDGGAGGGAADARLAPPPRLHDLGFAPPWPGADAAHGPSRVGDPADSALYEGGCRAGAAPASAPLWPLGLLALVVVFNRRLKDSAR